MTGLNVTSAFVKKLTKNIRAAQGTSLSHTGAMDLVSDALGLRTDALMHMLKAQKDKEDSSVGIKLSLDDIDLESREIQELIIQTLTLSSDGRHGEAVHVARRLLGHGAEARMAAAMVFIAANPEDGKAIDIAARTLPEVRGIVDALRDCDSKSRAKGIRVAFEEGLFLGAIKAFPNLAAKGMMYRVALREKVRLVDGSMPYDFGDDAIKSATPGGLTDLFTGDVRLMLQRQIKAAHGMSPEEYREFWGLPVDFPMIAKGYSAQKAMQSEESKPDKN